MKWDLLEVKEATKEFSGIKVLDKVNFNLKKGEVHVILGENGAGKSTLIKSLSGAHSLSSGKIYINGSHAIINTPQDGIENGISVIYQEFNLNPHMSICDNIFLGKEYLKSGIINYKKQLKEATRLCALVGLNINVKTKVSTLSIAKMQLVEIAKAISRKSKIIIFDEPTAAITDLETIRLLKLIENLKEQGIGIIYISHRMEEISKVGDRVTVLRDGKSVGTKYVKDVTEAELIKMVAGKEIVLERNTRKYESEVVLEVNNLTTKTLLSNIFFNLHKGEVLGVSGLVGSGRTEIAKCLIGAEPIKFGEVILNGKEYIPKSPKKAIENGIVYISEDRKNEGLIQQHSIKTNMLLGNLGSMKRFGIINKGLENKKAQELIEKFNIKASSYNDKVSTLSGGNQQKVVISKWINRGADIYIFDEPTRGIDISSRSEIYNIMEKILGSGGSIIMISSDMVEIMKMSNRILVMHEGKVSGILTNSSSLTKETIIRYAMGREMNYVI